MHGHIRSSTPGRSASVQDTERVTGRLRAVAPLRRNTLPRSGGDIATRKAQRRGGSRAS